MSLEVFTQGYKKNLASEIEKRVGSVGRRSVYTGDRDRPDSQITLSRGGFYVKGSMFNPRKAPLEIVYFPGMAAIRQDKYSAEGNGYMIDAEDSHLYVFHQPDDEAEWEITDVYRHSIFSARDLVDTYHLDYGRPVVTFNEGEVISSLISQFDEGLGSQMQQAIEIRRQIALRNIN